MASACPRFVGSDKLKAAILAHCIRSCHLSSDGLMGATQLVTLETEKAALIRDVSALQTQLEREWAAREANDAKAAAGVDTGHQSVLEARALAQELEKVNPSFK